MATSGWQRLIKILLRVGLIYTALLLVWMFAASPYHLLLAKTAGVLIPAFSDSDVQRVWLISDSAGVGAHFRITSSGRDSSYALNATQKVQFTSDTVVDIRQFGYPIVIVLTLALGIFPPRRILDTWPILAGFLAVYLLSSLWVTVEVYQYLARQELEFLRHNIIAQIISPDWYNRYRVPLIVYGGQLIPICVYGALYSGRLFRSVRKPR